jgi:hypothetical protein
MNIPILLLAAAAFALAACNPTPEATSLTADDVQLRGKPMSAWIADLDDADPAYAAKAIYALASVRSEHEEAALNALRPLAEKPGLQQNRAALAVSYLTREEPPQSLAKQWLWLLREEPESRPLVEQIAYRSKRDRAEIIREAGAIFAYHSKDEATREAAKRVLFACGDEGQAEYAKQAQLVDVLSSTAK